MLKINIYKIHQAVFEGEAESLVLPGADGELGVLDNHRPLISSLKRGMITLRKGREVQTFEINGGFVEVRPESKVVILAN
jgi:F-type H+-transporting ATPase subunit epsilon